MKTIKYLLFSVISRNSVVSFSQDKIDLLILNKHYQQALQQIEKKLEKEPAAELYLKKGLIYNSLQNYQDAVNAFSAALEIEPQNPEILGEMAEALSVLGNYTDANSFYEQALTLHPQNLQLAGKLGRNYINLKNYKKAYEIFSDIYKTDSTNVYLEQTICIFRLSNQIIVNWLFIYTDKVIDLNPRDYSSYFNLIKLYLMQEEQDNALAVIQLGLAKFSGRC